MFQPPDLPTDIFGSVAPKLLRRCHRLVVSRSSMFRDLLTVLKCKAGEFGAIPPSIKARPPDYGVGLPAFDPGAFAAWAEAANQMKLIEHIENIKFGGCYSLICSALLPEKIIHRMADSPIGQLLMKGGDDGVWFDALEEYVDDLGWIYLSLPEYTQYDLIVFSDAEAVRALPLVDGIAKPLFVEWRDGLAVWPPEWVISSVGEVYRIEEK